VIAMNKLGVKSFVDKTQRRLFFKAIDVVYSGNVFLPSCVAEILQKHLPELESIDPKKPVIPLSDFELYLLRLVCTGLSSTEIGQLANKSHRTIEDYRERLYKKFNVGSKEKLIVEAMRQNLI
jgi:DNA-binding NarL/FixJ family response regulator